jgi:phosphate transport system ATP-binding protein
LEEYWKIAGITVQNISTYAIDLKSILPNKCPFQKINEIAIKIENLSLFYGRQQALSGINMEIPKKNVTAYIGPSGCGKSTLLCCINRMNDLVDNVTIEGKVLLENDDIYHKSVNVSDLR